MSDEEEPADQYSSALHEFCGFEGVGGLVVGQDSDEDGNPQTMKSTGEVELANTNVIAASSFGAFDSASLEASNDFGGFSAFNDALAEETAGPDTNALSDIDSAAFKAIPNAETAASHVSNDLVNDPDDFGVFSAFDAAVVCTEVSHSISTESTNNENEPNENAAEANNLGGFSAFDNNISTTEVTQSNPIELTNNEAQTYADQLDQSSNNSGSVVDSNLDGFSAFDALPSSTEVVEKDSTLEGVTIQSLSDNNELNEPQLSTFNAITSSDANKQEELNGLFLVSDTIPPAPTFHAMKNESKQDSNDEFGDFSGFSNKPASIAEDNNFNLKAGGKVAVVDSNNETDEFTGFATDESATPNDSDMAEMQQDHYDSVYFSALNETPALITTNAGATEPDAPSEVAQEVPSDETEFDAGIKRIEQEPLSDVGPIVYPASSPGVDLFESDDFGDFPATKAPVEDDYGDGAIIDNIDAADADVNYFISTECKGDNIDNAENTGVDTNESNRLVNAIEAPMEGVDLAYDKNEDGLEAANANVNYLLSAEHKEDSINLDTVNDGELGSFADFEEGGESAHKINPESTATEFTPFENADAGIESNSEPMMDEFQGFTSFEQISGPVDPEPQVEDEDFGDFAFEEAPGPDTIEGNEHSIPDESQEYTPNNQQMFEEADDFGDFAAFEDTSTPGIGGVDDVHASEPKDKSEPPENDDDDFGDFGDFEEFPSESEERASNERTVPAAVLNEGVRVMFEAVFEKTSQINLDGNEGLELPFDVPLSRAIVSFVCV